MRLDIIATAAAGPSMQICIEDLTRSSYKNFRWASQKNFIEAPMHRVFKILMQGPPLRRVSTGSPQDLLTRSCTRSSCTVRTPGGFHKDLFKSSAKGPVQDHAKASDSMSLGYPQDLHARASKRISQDRQKRIFCCWSGSYKISIQEPPTSLPQELSYTHL